MIVGLLDMEAIVIDKLTNDVDLDGFDARFSTETPKSFTRPWVRVYQLDAIAIAPNDAVNNYFMQLDCYAGSSDNSTLAAGELARAVRRALHPLTEMASEGVVNLVLFTGHRRSPDDALDPPRQRFILDVEITAHP